MQKNAPLWGGEMMILMLFVLNVKCPLTNQIKVPTMKLDKGI